MYKVLVADDETIERMVLCKTLKKNLGENIEIFQAKNGREAVEVFEKEKIQVVILDIEMPGLNGLDAAKIMREKDEYVMIIFLTAFSEFAYAKQAISVHALDYILKPYDEAEILYALEEAFRLVDRLEDYKTETRLEMNDIPKEGMTGELRLSMVKEMIKNYIKAHYAEDISMNDLAEKMNYSEAYFCKLFKQCFGINFTGYMAEYRVGIAKKLLEDPTISIKEVGRSCGYSDSNYFSRVFKRSTGYTPSEYRVRVAVK